MNLLHVQHGSGGIDIEHDRQAAQIWYNLAQKFESLATKIALLVRQPGDVAARSRKTGDQAGACRVPRRREYDRNDRCRFLYRKGWNGSPRDTDIDLEPDEYGRDRQLRAKFRLMQCSKKNYSITSSANASSAEGIKRPSALAVV